VTVEDALLHRQHLRQRRGVPSARKFVPMLRLGGQQPEDGVFTRQKRSVVGHAPNVFRQQLLHNKVFILPEDYPGMKTRVCGSFWTVLVAAMHSIRYQVRRYLE